MSASASSSDATAGRDGPGGPGSGAAAAAPPAAGKKTNVCLICGIYTNLSLNIFEPRNGPNIREVIYQKYNFRAERSDTEDKYICFSCNNWLINWYSLQHLSESRNYESTPSSSRQSQSQSENRNKRPKNNGRSSSSSSAPGSSRDKENLEQDNVVSSTVKTPEKENSSPKSKKPKRPPFGTGVSGRPVLKQSSQQNLISSSSTISSSRNLVKPFESHLIRMLENQGTSVIKEPKLSTNPASRTEAPSAGPDKRTLAPHGLLETANSSEIILSFNSAISEVVDVLPSLNSLRHAGTTGTAEEPDEYFLRTHRMSRSLSISLIDSGRASAEH